MEHDQYVQMQIHASSKQMMDQTISYVAENMSRFVRSREYVLICFSGTEEYSLGRIFEQAVLRLDAIPMFWEPDRKWKSLLRQCFATRASVIIGPPLVVLGLSKLAKATGTPLNIRHAVTAGYPCMDWMIDGIIRGLDCQTWGCFGPGTGSIISGFSCGASRGVHIRQDTYDIRILDTDGHAVPDGEDGLITVSFIGRDRPRIRLRDYGCLDRSMCSCGQASPRLVNIHPTLRFQDDVLELYQELHSWTSILDCRIVKGDCGLELELVVFPGEKLPKLPTCAKQIVRPWNPGQDVPMDLQPEWKRY